MSDSIPPQPSPEDESPWIIDAEEVLPSATPPEPIAQRSVRPVTRQLGPRPRGAPAPRDEGSGWQVAVFLLGGFTLLAIVFGGGYLGLSALDRSQRASREQAMIQADNYTYTVLPYAKTVKLLMQLKSLETDEERSKDLLAGFAAGELGTDEATAQELKLAFEPLLKEGAEKGVSSHLSRPHLLRRVLPLVPQELRINFALMTSMIPHLGFTDPQMTLVRVRPWDTGDSTEEGRVVYAHIQSGNYGESFPYRFWMVRDQGVWKCVDFELTDQGVSSGEMATLMTCCLICEEHPLNSIYEHSEGWINSPIVQNPEAELTWINGTIEHVPEAIRDAVMIGALDRLHAKGLSDELYASRIASFSESTRSTLRGKTITGRHLDAGRAKDCLQECDAFRTRFGDTSPKILMDRIHALLTLGRFDDALRDLESFSPRFPTEISQFSGFALACRPDDVQPLVAAVMRHPRPREAISYAYYALNETRGSKSLKQFVEALARDPRFRADAARIESWQAEKSSDPQAALQAQRRALDLAPAERRDEFLESNFQYLLSHGQSEEACQLYPDETQLVAALMQAHDEEDYWPYEKEAARSLLAPLSRLTAARPQDHQAWYLLGLIHSSLEDKDKAVEAYAHSIQVETAQPPSTDVEASGETADSPERSKLAYFTWFSALQSAGQWAAVDQAIEKDPQLIEQLVQSLSWSTEEGLTAWAKRYLAEHPESPRALTLQLALAQQAEDWTSAREHLAVLIDQEKDQTQLESLNRQLAVACINDPELETACKQMFTSKNLDLSCQILQQRGETETLLRLMAILTAKRTSAGIRKRLPFWEAQVFARIGRDAELCSPAIQKLFVDPPAEDLEVILALQQRWNGHTSDAEQKDVKDEVLPPTDPRFKQIQLAQAVRQGNMDQLQSLLSDKQLHPSLQKLYSQPSYHLLWTAPFRPIREIAPPTWTQTYFQDRQILLEPGEAPDPEQWETRLKGLHASLGQDIEIVPLSPAQNSPARQMHAVRSGEIECVVSMGSQPADEFESNNLYSHLTSEHRDLLRTHRWWIQVTPANSFSTSLWSETVAAAIINEQTIAVYHDDRRRAHIGPGPMEYRAAMLEVHRFAKSDQPWSGLDRQKLRTSMAQTDFFWLTGPQSKVPPPQPAPESMSLFEQFRSCPSEQVVRVTVQTNGIWYANRLEVDLEQIEIQRGDLHSIRCRVATPVRQYPRLVQGEPVQLSPYQLDGPHTVPRASVEPSAAK